MFAHSPNSTDLSKIYLAIGYMVNPPCKHQGETDINWKTVTCSPPSSLTCTESRS